MGDLPWFGTQVCCKAADGVGKQQSLEHGTIQAKPRLDSPLKWKWGSYDVGFLRLTGLTGSSVKFRMIGRSPSTMYTKLTRPTKTSSKQRGIATQTCKLRHRANCLGRRHHQQHRHHDLMIFIIITIASTCSTTGLHLPRRAADPRKPVRVGTGSRLHFQSFAGPL